MKTLKKMLYYYTLGIALAIVWIGFIHLYSYIAEPYFSYAEWNNILLIALISGIPFAIGIGAINHLKATK